MHEFPCFEPSPQTQTILHCLLHHLLQRDKSEEALQLFRLSEEKPHFSHCLEWLLFTVFEAEISSQNANRNQSVVDIGQTCFLLLVDQQTCLKNVSKGDGIRLELAICLYMIRLLQGLKGHL